MSTEILEINYNKETNFDFELSITGISAADAKVRFGIELPGYTLQIPCSRGDSSTWSVTVPALEKFVDEGQYTFTIELIANGYHFAPVKGTASLKPVAEVVGSVPRKSVEVNVSGITKKDKPKKEEQTKEEKKEEQVVKKAEKEEEKKEEKKEAKEEVKEEVDIAKQMIEKRWKPLDKGRSILSQLRERTDGPELTEADKKVKDILKGM